MGINRIDHIEFATRENVVARRNYLLGLWAGGKLGLKDDELAVYVEDVMASDHQIDGPDDVVEKVANDLTQVTPCIKPRDVMIELMKTERKARAELLVTD